jgi:hypothetical protein
MRFKKRHKYYSKLWHRKIEKKLAVAWVLPFFLFPFFFLFFLFLFFVSSHSFHLPPILVLSESNHAML